MSMGPWKSGCTSFVTVLAHDLRGLSECEPFCKRRSFSLQGGCVGRYQFFNLVQVCRTKVHEMLDPLEDPRGRMPLLS